jgi:5-hydroxyisourate hydrolase
MSQITTHVLDVALGKPAVAVPVILEMEMADGEWMEISRGATDADGRVKHLLEPGSLSTGIYRLTFDTRAYFESIDAVGLYPLVAIAFEVRNPGEHYHIPLLLSPYGYSTYRGS